MACFSGAGGYLTACFSETSACFFLGGDKAPERSRQTSCVIRIGSKRVFQEPRRGRLFRRNTSNREEVGSSEENASNRAEEADSSEENASNREKADSSEENAFAPKDSS